MTNAVCGGEQALKQREALVEHRCQAPGGDDVLPGSLSACYLPRVSGMFWPKGLVERNVRIFAACCGCFWYACLAVSTLCRCRNTHTSSHA